jgi:drug/metabolite transporter (DMT)-like permease
MENWVILTFLYAIIIGVFHCGKKKAIEKNSVYEVLACFSLIAFMLSALISKNVMDIELSNVLIIFVKSLIIVIAWIISLKALEKMPVSLYSVLNLSRIIFSVIMSVIFFGERITVTILLGIIIVLVGLILVNRNSSKKDNKETSLKAVIMVVISCLLNSFSAIIDKKVLLNITSDQLQFWFLLFLTIMYWLILLFQKRKLNFKNIKKNYWIIIIAICLTIGDKFLFMANEIPESKVSIMTIVKQFSAIEAIILGKIIFKEKNIINKLLCSLLIVVGIVLTLI